MDDYEEMDLDGFRSLVHGLVDVEIDKIHAARERESTDGSDDDDFMDIFEQMVALAMHKVAEELVKAIFKEAYTEAGADE